MNKILSRILAGAALATVASTALASGPAPVPVPEADSIGLIVAGIAAGIAALKLRRRK